MGELLGDEERLAVMAAASASLAMPDAARRIADEVLAAHNELPLFLSPVISGKGTAEPVMSGDWASGGSTSSGSAAPG